MSRFTLYTYLDVKEFNKLYSQLNDEGSHIYSFLFEKTAELLEYKTDVTIDISALVENIQYNPGNRQYAIHNLRELDESTKVIVRSQLANQALEYFYILFNKVEPLYDNLNQDETDLNNTLIPFKRKVLYTYKNGLQLDYILEFANKNKIPFTNFSKLTGTENQNLRSLCNEQKRAIIDLTTTVKAIDTSPQIVYLVEQALESFPYYDAVVREDVIKEALDSFRLLFNSQKSVSELLEGIVLPLEDPEEAKQEERVKRLVDLNGTQLNAVCIALNSQLIGHNEFKLRFKESIENFRSLNRINEKKIFSIFLLGNSGLGKTEVARIIKNSLNHSTAFTKINFGNYSSKDALNSLIGSPKGYIGCEDGELGVKISKSKAGIILCDEFEKATFPVYNFFLELLEDGSFTDSMSREYNLDGYIIIFTSNINEKQFYEQIPQELQSRIDLVCQFKLLNKQDKIAYLDYQVEIFLEKLKADTDLLELSHQDIAYFGSIVDSTDNLRDIKRMIRERIMNKLKNG
jgi:hypothetical protein